MTDPQHTPSRTIAYCERYVDRRPVDPVQIFYWPASGRNTDFRPRDAQYTLPRFEAERFAGVLRECGNVVRLVPEKAP